MCDVINTFLTFSTMPPSFQNAFSLFLSDWVVASYALVSTMWMSWHMVENLV